MIAAIFLSEANGDLNSAAVAGVGEGVPIHHDSLGSVVARCRAVCHSKHTRVQFWLNASSKNLVSSR